MKPKKSKLEISTPSRKITKKTILSEILQKNPEKAEILFEAGMHCLGCPMAQQESLEDGCKAHGMGKKEIEELVSKLNLESCLGAEASSSERLNK